MGLIARQWSCLNDLSKNKCARYQRDNNCCPAVRPACGALDDGLGGGCLEGIVQEPQERAVASVIQAKETAAEHQEIVRRQRRWQHMQHEHNDTTARRNLQYCWGVVEIIGCIIHTQGGQISDDFLFQELCVGKNNSV